MNPTITASWAANLGYEYEVWSDPDGILLEHYGAFQFGEPLPYRHAYILDADGNAVVFHEGAVSMGADPDAVLEDCAFLF